MTKAALSVRNLRIWFESGSARTHAVDDISFDILPGESVGLVGESGCGKSMTALAILGLLPGPGISSSCQSIEINGTDISTLNESQRRGILGRDIAMIFQQPGTALDPVFTIGSLVGSVFRRHFGGDRKSVHREVLTALESVGFSQPEEIAAAYPHQLSGGMRQLAMIAMATVCKPDVLIADEPTTALDNSTRLVILQQLAKLQQLHQTAVLLISHDLSVIKRNCSKVMVMYCGRLVEKTDCSSLFTRARHPYSAGLVSCIPQICAGPAPEFSAIPGQVPAPGDLPAGCHFAPRCSHAQPVCAETFPHFEETGGTGIACFRPLQ